MYFLKIFFCLDYNPLTSTSDGDQPEEIFHNEDDIAHAIHERLSNFFRGYNRQ